MITDAFELISITFYCAANLSYLFYDIYHIFDSCFLFKLSQSETIM